MATETRKVLGQADLAAATLTAVYTVPAATQAVVSSIMLCNRAAVPTTVRVSVAVAGAADAVKQYIYYDVKVLGTDTLAATLGITLGAGDIVRCRAVAAGVSASVFGVEIA